MMMAANSITVFGLECFVAGRMGSMTGKQESCGVEKV